MSGRIPTTRSAAVSDSHLPTLIPGRRVRSLGAALAGGPPPSSSSPSGSGRAPSPIPESVHPLTALPHQFQSDVREYLKTYRVEVEALASARSMLSKLRKHKHAKSYPAALNSIKSPSIQFSRAFVNSPTTEGHRGTYSIASGTALVVFEQSVDQAVKAFKDEVLKCWTSEKDK